MSEKDSSALSGYIFAVVVGAIAGGLIIAIASKAIPKMMSEMARRMTSHCDDGSLESSRL